MSQNIEITGINYIKDFVKNWTNKYVYQISYIEKSDKGHTFITEFSLPIQQKPIPVATVKVYFFLNLKDDGDIDMKFRFENDSLIHKPDRTLRISKIEKWLEKFLDKKSQTSKVLFLGTDFEATRIKDERLDKIYEEINYKEEIKEQKYLSPDLLEESKELEHDDEHCDEDLQIDTLRTSLFSIFRSVDKDDMGVVSLAECKEVFKLMGLQLTSDEWTQLISMVDADQNGLIEYSKFLEQGVEIIYAIFMKNSAKKNLAAREEEFMLQSILILHSSEIHGIIGALMEDITKLDEDEELTVPILPELKQILNKHNEVINQNEVDEIIKIIQREYTDNKFPYKELYTVLLDYKIQNLKNGLMESSINKLEIYIRSICEPYDKNKRDLIHIDDLMKAFAQSDKIVLSKTQSYIIRSFVEKDENNQVNYILASRILAAMVKKFFTPDLLKKKVKLVQQGYVKTDEEMEGWSQDEINQELQQLFQRIDKKGQDKIELDQVKQLIKQAKLNITEEEITQTFRDASQEEGGFVTVDEFIGNFYNILKLLRCSLSIERLSDL